MNGISAGLALASNPVASRKSRRPFQAWPILCLDQLWYMLIRRQEFAHPILKLAHNRLDVESAWVESMSDLQGAEAAT